MKDILKKLFDKEGLSEEEVARLLQNFYTETINTAAHTLSNNLSKSKNTNQNCDKVLTDFFEICKRLFDYIDKDNAPDLKKGLEMLELSNMIGMGAELVENIEMRSYPTLEIFASGIVIQDVVKNIKDVVFQIDLLQGSEKEGEIKLLSFMRTIEKVIKSIERYYEIVAHLDNTIGEQYDKHNKQFLETQATLFGSRATFNVQFKYNDNRVLTELYNDILNTLKRGIKMGDIKDIIHIYQSDEYQAISNRQYITQIQAINFANTGSLLAPFIGSIWDLCAYDLSQENIQIQNTCNSTLNKEVRKMILNSMENQNIQVHIIDSLNKGNYKPTSIKRAETEKKQVGDTRLVIVKKEIFKNFEAIGKFIEEKKTLFKKDFVRKIDVTYDKYKKGENKEGEKDEDTIKFLKMLQKLEVKIEEYTKTYEKWIKGKSTDTERGENVDNYVFSLDDHSLIDGLIPQTLTQPGPVIGESIDKIKTGLVALLNKDPVLETLNQSYNGSEKNLLNNSIILGPFGSGKTALLRELGYNKDFVTIPTSYGSISSMRFGTIEKNVKQMFEEAYRIHQETGKQVLLLIDEFDSFFNINNPIGSNSKEGIQKQLQIALDGVVSYPGVHLIGLSNVPQGIPMDIYRRAKTFVIEKLKDKEIVELINSRLGKYHMDTSMQEMFTYIEKGDYSHKDLYGNIAKNLNNASPKIIASVCKQVADAYFAKIGGLEDQNKSKAFGKKLKKLNANKKTTDQTYKSLFLQLDTISISSEDFISVADQEFENPVIKQEIEVYNKFYDDVKTYIGKIKGSFEK